MKRAVAGSVFVCLLIRRQFTSGLAQHAPKDNLLLLMRFLRMRLYWNKTGTPSNGSGAGTGKGADGTAENEIVPPTALRSGDDWKYVPLLFSYSLANAKELPKMEFQLPLDGTSASKILNI